MILALPLLLLSPAARAEKPAAPVAVAGSVVRSKEWIVRRGKSREEEFVGDVRYDAADARLTADWALYRQEPDDWQARGKVFARKTMTDGDAVEARGETARFSKRTEAGTLEPARGGRVSLLRVPAEGGGPDRAEGDHLSWVGQNEGVLSGRARGWGPRGEFWADAAHYERLPAASLTLTGRRPVLHNVEGEAVGALKADRIVAYDAPRRAVATGRALGWILSQSSVTVPGDIARCERGDGRPGPDANTAALLAPKADAAEEKRFWEASDAAFAARACPWGPRLDFSADEADYDEAAGRRLVLSGGRPVARKRDVDWSTAMKADLIVAVGATRRVVASGRVRGWLIFKDEGKFEERLR